MELKGKLLIIGGAENKGNENFDEFITKGVLERLLKESGQGKLSRIEIITTASTVPDEMEKMYTEAFTKLQAYNIGFLHIKDRNHASQNDVLTRLSSSNVIFFTGGDQLRLTSILGGTPFFQTLKKRLESDTDFMYAGTSAGAAVASDCMICEGESKNALKKGEIKTAAGFGFVDHIVFDIHFIRRGRIGRLLQIIAANPMVLGVGLEEDTALLISDNKMEAVGSGSAIIADGRMIKNTNLSEVRHGMPISIEQVILHAISCYDVYDLSKHTLEIRSPEKCH